MAVASEASLGHMYKELPKAPERWEDLGEKDFKGGEAKEAL